MASSVVNSTPSDHSENLASIDATSSVSTAMPNFSPFKPTVIGIYGLPGAGKTYLLEMLKGHADLKDQPFAFYNGSEVIETLMFKANLNFRELSEEDKTLYREKAISHIRHLSQAYRQTALVTGHYVFWPEESEEAAKPVWTECDASTYTHILYLDVDAEALVKRRAGDVAEFRPPMSAAKLEKWQKEEKVLLRKACYELGILFIVIHPDPAVNWVGRVVTLLLDFVEHSEEKNLARAERRLDDVVAEMKNRTAAEGSKLQRMLIFDGDRTLTAHDTATLLCRASVEVNMDPCQFNGNPLKAIFSSPLGYSYTAFRQAALVFEELHAADPSEFGRSVLQITSAAGLYGDFLLLLRKAADRQHIGVIMLTSGLKHIWESILQENRLSDAVKVIGGGCIADEFVVNAKVKAAVASRLKTVHSLETWAFGDSILDLGMLVKADRAVVVVGDIKGRSDLMEKPLEIVIDAGVLQGAYQVVMARDAPPRLTAQKLPLTTMSLLTKAILARGDNALSANTTSLQPTTSSEQAASHRELSNTADLVVHHATDKSAARLLMTPTRDSKIAGPALRDAHRRVGWYLAHEYLSTTIGLEEYDIDLVQNKYVVGHRLLHEASTLIIALMRGGEPMAFGINDAFPLAAFLHAKEPEQVTAKHLAYIKTVILVDSVINSGKSVLEFIIRLQEVVLKTPSLSVRFVIVAGVVQEEAIEALKDFVSGLDAFGARLTLVALRLSKNKYTGKGGTDTGHRLFNTTFLD